MSDTNAPFDFDDLQELFEELDEATADAAFVFGSGLRRVVPEPSGQERPEATTAPSAAAPAKRPTVELSMDDVEVTSRATTRPRRHALRPPPLPTKGGRASGDDAATREVPAVGRLR